MIAWQETIDALRGAPFRSGARGPDAFDCWGLCAEVSRRLGQPLPEYGSGVDAADPSAIGPAVAEVCGSGAWARVDGPEPGDILCMSKVVEIHHLGIWTPHGVLHALPVAGVVLSSLALLRRLGYRRMEWWRWAG